MNDAVISSVIACMITFTIGASITLLWNLRKANKQAKLSQYILQRTHDIFEEWYAENHDAPLGKFINWDNWKDKKEYDALMEEKV